MSVARDTVERRKAMPLASGVLDYFPDALLVVAEVSRIGNEQHHPGEPLHWDKSKSTDEADALMRHLLDRGTIDTDGVRHTAKVAWRALALLQRELDAEDAMTWDDIDMAQEAEEVRGSILHPAFKAEYRGMDLSDTEDVTVEVDLRGDWPADTRVAGLLTCCGQSEHSLDCPQWRS